MHGAVTRPKQAPNARRAGSRAAGDPGRESPQRGVAAYPVWRTLLTARAAAIPAGPLLSTAFQSEAI